jgi:N-acetylglucosamine kinase-like BadF-type ATPase
MGIPGYGEVKDDTLKLESIISEVYQSMNYKIGNDVETGWAGSLACKPGINVVCGTGAIAIGVDETYKTARCSGWGPFIGDEGSAYWIGKKGLEVFSKQSDGRYDKTKFYEIFKERLNLEYDFQIIDLVHNKIKLDRSEIAKFSMIISEIAKTGDIDAIKIFKEAAEEIYLMVKSIVKQLKLNGKINMSYVGGVFNAGDLILEPLRKRFEEKSYNVEIIPPILEAWEGAALYAYQLAGNEITEELINNIKKHR